MLSLSQALATSSSFVAVISGYEVYVVALAVVGLVVLVGSSLAGLAARFTRGVVDEPSRRRWRRRGRRSPSD